MCSHPEIHPSPCSIPALTETGCLPGSYDPPRLDADARIPVPEARLGVDFPGRHSKGRGGAGQKRQSGCYPGSSSGYFCPDPEVAWVPRPATRRARRIVEEQGIDTVLVTAPPFSAFLIGNALEAPISIACG